MSLELAWFSWSDDTLEEALRQNTGLAPRLSHSTLDYRQHVQYHKHTLTTVPFRWRVTLSKDRFHFPRYQPSRPIVDMVRAVPSWRARECD
jgi:hypothetical protein